MNGKIHLADNLEVLRALPSASVDLIYIDPPFNTGKTQVRRTLATDADVGSGGDRTGFGGRRYASRLPAESSYADEFEDSPGLPEPRRSGATPHLTPRPDSPLPPPSPPWP